MTSSTTTFLLFSQFIILPAIIPAQEKRPWKEFGPQTALFLGVFFLLLLPWMIRNYKAGGQFNVSIFASFAIAWFIGKNPEKKQQNFFPQA